MRQHTNPTEQNAHAPLPSTTAEPDRPLVDAAWVFERYESIRARLPQVGARPETQTVSSLADLTDRFDTFLFDSFGVLNVGERTIPGAVERIAALRAAGKRVLVLTNAASIPLAGNVRKYKAFGFDFAAEEIVSSRAVLAAGLVDYPASMLWSVFDKGTGALGDLAVRAHRFEHDIASDADGVILCTSAGWTPDHHAALADFLSRRPVPLLIGNPDLAAPRENGFSLEPGATAHDLADTLGIEPVFFGKPYGNAFEMACARVGEDLDRSRTLMVGDTLHTDILGGQAAGLATALVTDHGVLKGMEVDACIDASGIAPDYSLPSI